MVTMPSSLEAGVQAAVGVVAHQGEIVVAAVIEVARRHDLAVGLHGDAGALVVLPPTAVVTMPSPLKLVSRLPSAL